MAILLKDQRETLQLGQLVPVGDLYDLVAQGDEAVTEGMKRTFEMASRLYHQEVPAPTRSDARAFRSDSAWKRSGVGGARRAAAGAGLQVRLRKLDPDLNLDPGTMSPYQHGEVFVTDDGAETDLDLGHYERFTGSPATRRTTSPPAASIRTSSPRNAAAIISAPPFR